MKCTPIGEKRCSCFEIDQEMDAILLIIGIAYGVCRIIIKSIQQCTYFLFSVNLLLVGVNALDDRKKKCRFCIVAEKKVMQSPVRNKNIALLNLSSLKPTTDETVKQQLLTLWHYIWQWWVF